MYLIAYSICFALVAFVYCHILTDGGMILNGWYNWLDKHIGHKKWLFKPLIGCSKCVAGQAGLWGYFYYMYAQQQPYDLAHHIFCICLSIYAVKFISQAWSWN